MARLSREEYLARIQGYVGDRTDDETLSFVEDMTDSFPEDSGNSDEWQSRYNELEGRYNDLARRYRDRFLTTAEPTVPQEETDVGSDFNEPDNKPKTIKDILSENIG